MVYPGVIQWIQYWSTQKTKLSDQYGNNLREHYEKFAHYV